LVYAQGVASLVDNGRHQLQAYVFPDHADLLWGGTSKPTVAEIVIKNSGQTPAYKLSTATAIGIDDYPPRNGPTIPAMPPTRTVVPPPGNYSLTVALPEPLTGEQLRAIQKGTQAIYAFGEIGYTDPFGECRLTRYEFYYSGAGGDNGSRTGLSYLDEGNSEVPCSEIK
jgi:hypothetical protein